MIDASTSQPVAHMMGLSAGMDRTDLVENLSRRGTIESTDQTLIAGFVLSGGGEKELLVRAAGPALSKFDVPNALNNPSLALFAGAELLESNENWGESAYPQLTAAKAVQVGAFAFDDNSRDSALLTSLPSGVYSAHVNPNGGLGSALFEVYDTEPNASDGAIRLVNISTRGRVVGDEILPIGGFVVSGNHPKRILIRAAGSTMEDFGVPDFLPDPVLSVFEGQRLITRNDDWADYGEELISETSEKVGAFPFYVGSKESAVLLTLPPGVYTAHVAGVDGAAGESLVEIYEVE